MSGTDPSCGARAGDLHLGKLPVSEEKRVARLECPRRYHSETYGNTAKGWINRCVTSVGAVVESRLFTWIGNTTTWKRQCLPSSNGFLTARALARMYGALANHGQLADGCTLASPRTVALVSEAAADDSSAVPTKQTFGFPEPQLSMLALGFNPWPNPALHGPSPPACVSCCLASFELASD